MLYEFLFYFLKWNFKLEYNKMGFVEKSFEMDYVSSIFSLSSADLFLII